MRDGAPDLSARIGQSGLVPHPLDVLVIDDCADALAQAVGSLRAYRQLLQLALAQLAAQATELARVKAAYYRALEDGRRLRQLRRETVAP